MAKKIKRKIHGGYHPHVSPTVFVLGLVVFALASSFVLVLFPSALPTGASFINLGSHASAWTCTDGITVRVSDTSRVCHSHDEWSKIASSFCTVSGDISFSDPCVFTASCTDSDDGAQYYVPGTASGYDAAQSSLQLTNVSDTCIDATHLREWLCDSGASGGASAPVLRFDDYACPNGCSNGVCVSAPQALVISRFAFFRKTEDVDSTTFPSTSRSDARGSYWLLSNPILNSYMLYLEILGNDASVSGRYSVTLVPVRDTSISYQIAVGDTDIGSSNPYTIYNLKVPISGLNSGPIPQVSTLEEYTFYLNVSTYETPPRAVSTTQRVVLSR